MQNTNFNRKTYATKLAILNYAASNEAILKPAYFKRTANVKVLAAFKASAATADLGAFKGRANLRSGQKVGVKGARPKHRRVGGAVAAFIFGASA